LVFEFASRYCAENPATPDLKSFHITDKDYEKFMHLIKENKFTYSTPLERNTKQLIETAKKEKYYTEMEAQLNALKNKIDASKSTDMIRFKTEIIQVLEEQIAFHYTQNEGQAEVSLPRDRAVLEARKILNNDAAYKKILFLN
jgi:carboxyl-terminal processing protease